MKKVISTAIISSTIIYLLFLLGGVRSLVEFIVYLVKDDPFNYIPLWIIGIAIILSVMQAFYIVKFIK